MQTQTVRVPTKPARKSATVWLQVGLIVVMVADFIAKTTLNLGLPEITVNWIAVVAGVGTLVLRIYNTTLPIGPEGGVKVIEAPVTDAAAPPLPDIARDPEGNPR